MKQHTHDRRYLRLKHYDYSQEGAYFVTICTNSRRSYFAKYPNLQPIVHDIWDCLQIRFPFIELDEFVVMPNHVHGIIFIVGAIRESPLQLPPLESRRKMLLFKIIGYFKMNTAKQINKILNRTGQRFWQRNYYERVIRNEAELLGIRTYIQNNPLKWELDRDNPRSVNYNLEHDLYWKGFYGRGNS